MKTWITYQWLAKEGAHQVRVAFRNRLRVRKRLGTRVKQFSCDISPAELLHPDAVDRLSRKLSKWADGMRSRKPRFIHQLPVNLPAVRAYRADARDTSVRALEQYDPQTSTVRIRLDCLVSR